MVSSDDESSSMTPKPSTLNVQSAAESESAGQLSTLRPGIQSDTQDGSEIQIKETVEVIDKDPIANRKILNSTDSEGNGQFSGVFDSNARPNKLPNIGADSHQESVVDGLLWGSGAASLTSSHDKVTEVGSNEAQTKGLAVHYRSGDKATEDMPQEVVETSAGGTGEPRRSCRKRMRPENSSPSPPLPESSTLSTPKGRS